MYIHKTFRKEEKIRDWLDGREINISFDMETDMLTIHDKEGILQFPLLLL